MKFKLYWNAFIVWLPDSNEVAVHNGGRSILTVLSETDEFFYFRNSTRQWVKLSQRWSMSSRQVARWWKRNRSTLRKSWMLISTTPNSCIMNSELRHVTSSWSFLVPFLLLPHQLLCVLYWLECIWLAIKSLIDCLIFNFRLIQIYRHSYYYLSRISFRLFKQKFLDAVWILKKCSKFNCVKRFGWLIIM